MNIYKTNKNKLPGTSFSEVRKNADRIFDLIKSKTKRKPYIRSKYFKKEKVFLNIFWQHIFNKHEKDKVRRLRFFECGVDLIRNSTFHPTTKDMPNNSADLYYRFYGITNNREKFIVQIKENKRSKRKDLISIFPE